jgi:hypothetical protein
MQETQEITAESGKSPEWQAVEAEMKRVLEGTSFRSSPRCREFLKFVVTCALEGRHELLKERTIGVELFRRDPAYVTEADSIVRVRASEVRRRLLQHYATDTEEHPCRIQLPSGSYVPQFHMIEPPPPPSAEVLTAPPEPAHAKLIFSSKVRSLSKPVWIALIVGLLAVLLVQFVKPSFSSVRGYADTTEDHNEKQLEEFWMPAIRDSRPVLLCIGSPTTYTLAGRHREFLNRNAASQLTEQGKTLGTKTVEAKDASIPLNDVLAVHSEYVGAGDANLAVLLSAFFSRYGKATQFALSESTSYGQISDAPTVLVGAFTNQWTLTSVAKLPFSFVEQNHMRMVQENDNQRRQWGSPQLRADGKTDQDFAIVTRLSNSDTGKFLVTAAGISGFGSRAAGYFLTRPDLLARALDGAPREWPQKNIQFVLMTKIVDNAPTAPTVVARRVW